MKVWGEYYEQFSFSILKSNWNNFEKFEVYTAQKMKFSINDFFSKCDQIRRKLRIWSHLPKKSLMKNFIFCAVILPVFMDLAWT